MEDRFRSYIYFANKEKLVKYDELVRFGLGSERVELDIFADYTRDELFSLRSILEESQDEWNSYKVHEWINIVNIFLGSALASV